MSRPGERFGPSWLGVNQGYLCEVCGAVVEDLVDSDLCPRCVLGEEEFRFTRGDLRLLEVLAPGLPIALYPSRGTHSQQASQTQATN